MDAGGNRDVEARLERPAEGLLMAGVRDREQEAARHGVRAHGLDGPDDPPDLGRGERPDHATPGGHSLPGADAKPPWDDGVRAGHTPIVKRGPVLTADDQQV